jgi:hypothetical protein
MNRPIALVPALLAAASLFGALMNTSASAATIGINHQGFGGSNTALESDDLAGVLPSDHWNNINASNFNFSNLVQDNDGDSSTSNFTTTTTDVSGGTGDRNNLNGSAPSSPDEEMLEGFNQFNSSNRTRSGLGITVSSLESTFTDPGYDIYVYYGNTNSNRQGRVDLYLGSSTTAHESSPLFEMIESTSQFSGTFVNAEDVSSTTPSHYVMFDVRPGDDVDISQFKMTVTGDFTGISGVQIVAVPEPASLALLAAGGFCLLTRQPKSASGGLPRRRR